MQCGCILCHTKHERKRGRANSTGAPHNPVDEHLKSSSGWKCPRAAVIFSQLHKPVSRSCLRIALPGEEKSFHKPSPLEKSVSQSLVYIHYNASILVTGKTSKKVQDQQDSQALCPTTLPWRDFLVTIVPTCSLCLNGSINWCLLTLFSHPFPRNKGISSLWNLYCCWQTQLRLVMCNSYYWEHNWQSNMTLRTWCFLCMCS